MESLGLMGRFWNGKRVLITGHTGFKGSWLSEILLGLGANVSGFSLPPEGTTPLYDQLDLSTRMNNFIGDIRHEAKLMEAVKHTLPDIVFHLAAQPLVRKSYRRPLETWSTNVMGTANLLEALRTINSLCAVVVVTTDKVYEDCELDEPRRENDRLGGYDPYSASKSATELAVGSWRDAFFKGSSVRVATARAGNVIGGGDWSEDRILPDLARAFGDGKPLVVRNTHAIRPWQHVMEPLHGYLLLAEALMSENGSDFETSFNFGPLPQDQRSVGALIEAASLHWSGDWYDVSDPGAPYEARRLSLCVEKAQHCLGWHPRWNFEQAVSATVLWYRDVAMGADPSKVVQKQIDDFGVWI